MSKGSDDATLTGAVGWNPAPADRPKPGLTARAFTVARVLASKGGQLVVLVAGLELVLPSGWKPSEMLGRWEGQIEAASYRAKQNDSVELKRREAEEVSREQAKVQWELTVLTRQMQSLYDSQTAKSDIANGSDWLCIIGRMAGGIDNRDVREVGKMMSGACGYSDAVRGEQQQAYAEMSRRHSALVQRNDELHRVMARLRPGS